MKLFGRPLYGYRQKVRLFVVVMRDRYSYRGSRAIYRAAAEIGEQWKTGRNVYLFTYFLTLRFGSVPWISVAHSTVIVA